VHVDLGIEDLANPLAWQHLRAGPLATAQVEVADLGHVARLHEQAIAADRNPLRIAAPCDVGDPQRPEQLLFGVLERIAAGLPPDDGRHEMPGAAVVVERDTGRLGHRPIEYEADPVGAALHLQHGLRRLVRERLTPAQAGIAVEQTLNRHRLLERIGVGDRPPRKEIEHPCVEAIELAFLRRDAGQRAHHAFGHRIHDVLQARSEGRVVRVENESAMPYDQDAVHRIGSTEVDEIGKLAWRHALFFG
jgi:hypothetical protein